MVGWANLVASMLFGASSADTPEGFAEVRLDLSDWEALADDPEGLIERIDVVFTGGGLSAQTRTAIREAIAPIEDDPGIRARVALYLALVSPDYVVES